MFSPNPVTTSTLPSRFQFQFQPRCLTLVSATFRRRSRSRSRRRHNKLTSPITITTTHSAPKLETVIDLTHLTTFQTLFHSNIRQFVSSATDAYADLQTLLTIDHNRRLVLSCRPSTLNFVATSTLFTFLAFSAFRFLLNLGSRFWSWHRNASSTTPMVRRDRSLGGREVVVGLGPTPKVPPNPLSLPVQSSSSLKRVPKHKVGVQRKLPKWWPPIINGAVFDVDDQDQYKREAYRVVRGLFASLKIICLKRKESFKLSIFIRSKYVC